MLDNLFILIVFYLILFSIVIHIVIGISFLYKQKCARDNNVYSCSLKYEYKWVPNK
jgi:5-bromo-4-chloroindolyl phosphate hydrolysis protein